MDTLRQLGKYWAVATRYWEILDPVIRESKPSVAIRIGELRRTAYYLQRNLYDDMKSRDASSLNAREELTAEELLSLDIFGTFNYPYVRDRRQGITSPGLQLPRIEGFALSNTRHDWSPQN